MSEPTPRPWFTGDSKTDIWGPGGDGCEVIAVFGITDGAGVEIPCENYEANAAHIVKCVNEHDRLVTACKDFASIKGKIPEFPGSAFLEIARDLARAALAETAEVPT